MRGSPTVYTSLYPKGNSRNIMSYHHCKRKKNKSDEKYGIKPNSLFEKQDISVSIFQEFLKLTVDLVDLFGLHFIIQRVSGKSQVKVCLFLFLLSNVVSEHLVENLLFFQIMVAGLGWAFADFLLTRVLFLWVGARGVEFDWKYLQVIH